MRFRWSLNSNCTQQRIGNTEAMHRSRWMTLLLAVAVMGTAFWLYTWATRPRPTVGHPEEDVDVAKPAGQPAPEVPVPSVVGDRVAEIAPPPRPSVTYYYPVTVGTKWVYQTRMFDTPDEDRTLVVTAVKGTGVEKVVTVERIGRNGKKSDWEKVRVSDGQVYRLEDQGTEDRVLLVVEPDRFYANPERAIAASSMSGRAQWMSGQWMSGSWRLSLPAGDFTAIKVEVSAGGTLGDLVVHYTEQSWYARDVGLVKRVVGPTEIRLKSFTPGKK